MAANSLANPDRIFEKQKLIIPARKELRNSGRSRPRTIPKRIPARYTVKASDRDLYTICRRFYGTKGQGARVAKVMELNGLWSADVKAGTTLILPPK